MKCEICDSCFAKAIAAENAVQTYYEKMAEYFNHVPQLHEFLTQMSLDEFKHAESLHESRKAEFHSDKIHAETRKMERHLDSIIGDVHTSSKKPPTSFDEVYSFAHEIENAELNSIFIFLTTEAMTYEGDTLGFMMVAMETHIQKVNQLTSLFDRAKMKTIFPSVKYSI